VTDRGTTAPTLTLKFTFVDSTLTFLNDWLSWDLCSDETVTFEELWLVDVAEPPVAPDGRF
jgi:hypothetical protein